MLFIVLAICAIVRNQRRLACWAIALLCFGLAAAVTGGRTFIPQNDISRYVDREITATVVVQEPPTGEKTPAGIRLRFPAGVVALQSGPAAADQIEGMALITMSWPNNQPLPQYGDQLRISGKLLAIRGYQNPGQADIGALYRRQNIGARLVVHRGPIHIVRADHWSAYKTILTWRQQMIALLDSSLRPQDAAVLEGMLFGGYRGIEPEIIRDFTATGLVHLLSVSGTHIALVAGVMWWLGGLVRLGRQGSAGLAALAILIYSVLSGGSPPVIRSAIMGFIVLGAITLGRARDGVHALCLTAAGMLLWEPLLLRDISFQLTLGATAGIIVLYPRLTGLIPRRARFLMLPLVVTLAAQLGTLPILAWYFNSVSLSAFLANCIATPLAEAAVVVGLAGCIAGTAAAVIGAMLLKLAGLMTAGVLVLTAFLAKLPLASIYIPSVSFPVGLLYYLLLAAWTGILPSSSIAVRRSLIAAACIMAILAGWESLQTRPVAIHFIDVGQGDAAVVQTPHGRTILIDTGGATGGFDVGERVVVPYLKHFDVRSVDYLLLTHGHQDHAGGAAAVMADMPVRTIIAAREEITPAMQSVRKQLGENTILISAYPGQTIDLDGVSVKVLHAPGAVNHRTGNESSCVYLVEYGRHRFLFTGDLDAEGEADLALQGLQPVTVLKTAHHGARTSSTQTFLDAAKPQFAVISAGYANQFGHPHQEILDRFTRNGIEIFRTDRQGAIIFYTDGNLLTYETYLPK